MIINASLEYHSASTAIIDTLMTIFEVNVGQLKSHQHYFSICYRKETLGITGTGLLPNQDVLSCKAWILQKQFPCNLTIANV